MKPKPVPPAEAAISTALRRYLYFTAAVTGGMIMIVEILGARMLAPYLGTSHFVWVAQIAVTLVALSAGYYVGGRWVDRSPKLTRLYTAILLAAVYLSLSVLVVKPVAYWCLDFNLATGALLAATFLFLIPLALLAMVGPFFVRVLTQTVGTVGGNVGRLTAISTLGSVVGTILIGYVLIPRLPNSVTMYLTSIILTVLSLLYFFVWGPLDRKSQRSKSVGPVLLGLLALGIGYGGVYRSQHVGYQRVEELAVANSPFGLLQVLQEISGERRIYLNDYLTQNTYDILAHQSMSMFTYMLYELPKCYSPRIENVLCIGMGVGIVPMQFVRDGAKVDVVEINPAVVPIARKYFDCQPERFGLTIGDGRYFVNQSKKKYDAIVLDAFLGDSSPSHLMSREAFTAMRGILQPTGTLVINCFGDFDPGRDFFVSSLDKTLRNVFRSVKIHNERNGGNVFFVASMQSELRQLRSPDLDAVHPEERHRVKMAFTRELGTDPDHGIVLTDDYNPVEFYDAGNREIIRKHLALQMQRF